MHMVGNHVMSLEFFFTNLTNMVIDFFLGIGSEGPGSSVGYTPSFFPRTVRMLLGAVGRGQNLPAKGAAIVKD